MPDELIQSANMDDELPDNWADEDAPQELADYGRCLGHLPELGCTACSFSLIAGRVQLSVKS